MKKFKFAALLALVLSLAAPVSAYAWDVDEDDDNNSSYSGSSDTSDSNDDSSGGHDDSDSNTDADGDSVSSTPVAIQPDDSGDDDDSDLYPAKRRSQDDDSDHDNDDDGWLGAGERRMTAEEEARAEEEEERSRDPENIHAKGGAFFGTSNIGLTGEFSLGGYFRQGPMGSLNARFGLGVSINWNMGKLLFDSDFFLNKALWLQLAWFTPLSASGDTGTDTVKVTQNQHNVTLAVLVGYPVWRLFIYGKFGPGLFVGKLDYDIDGSTASWGIVRGGIVYGVGVHTMHFFTDAIGISARLELTGQRRHYFNDLQLNLNIGLAF